MPTLDQRKEKCLNLLEAPSNLSVQSSSISAVFIAGSRNSCISDFVKVMKNEEIDMHYVVFKKY